MILKDLSDARRLGLLVTVASSLLSADLIVRCRLGSMPASGLITRFAFSHKPTFRKLNAVLLKTSNPALGRIRSKRPKTSHFPQCPKTAPVASSLLGFRASSEMLVFPECLASHEITATPRPSPKQGSNSAFRTIRRRLTNGAPCRAQTGPRPHGPFLGIVAFPRISILGILF